jgi:hypothetical protein
MMGDTVWDLSYAVPEAEVRWIQIQRATNADQNFPFAGVKILICYRNRMAGPQKG